INLNHAMGMCTLWGVSQNMRNSRVGGKVGPTDKGCPRTGIGCLVLSTPHSKLDYKSALAALTHPRGFCGYKCLIVKEIEQWCLQNLCHSQGALNDGYGDVRMNDATLRDSEH